MTSQSSLQSIDRPSTTERNSHYKPGSIKRVKLKNFLTYDAVEFFPGPRLNVVVGPNGTGKSTILCAICLGLGGQPPLLGRADDARLFIKHEKEKAEVEIELAPLKNDQGGGYRPIHIITRVIERDRGSEHGKGAGASTYFVNGNKSSLKSVKDLVTEKYKINIDNLCTFLPQDKVGNFSGFDKQALLAETERSLSGHLFSTHQELIQLENEVQSSGCNVQTMQDQLNDLQNEIRQLERDKELMEERQSYMERMDLLQKKRAWLVFDVKREQTKSLKETRESLKKQRKEAQSSLKPLIESHAQLEGETNRLRARTSALEENIKTDRKSYEDCVKKGERFGDEIEEVMGDYSSIDAQQRRAEREVEKQRLRLAEIRAEEADFPGMEEVDRSIATAQAELRSLKQKMDVLKKAQSNVRERMESEGQRKAEAESRLERIRDEKTMRRQRLFGMGGGQGKSLREAFEWIDQNRKMFRRPVSGPIAAEVQPDSAQTASFLELHVSNATWKSFVVECKEDYNLLYRELRQKRNIPVNIINVPNGKLNSVKRIYSEEKLQVLTKEYGFIGYLDETFAAPDQIMQALVDRHNVHKVLVGGEEVQKSLERKDLIEFLSEREEGDGKRGKQTSCFFYTYRDNAYRYTNSVSRYNGEIGTNVDDVGQAKLLKPGSDPNLKDEFLQIIESSTSLLSTLEPQIAQHQQEIETHHKQGQEITVQLRSAKRAKQDYSQFKMKLANQEDKLAEAEENANRDNKSEKKRMVQKIKKLVESSLSMIESADRAHCECMKSTYTLTGVKMTEDGLLDKLRKMADALVEKKNETAEIESRYKQADTEYDQAKKELRLLLNQAEEIAPKDEWYERLERDDLPEDLEGVEEALDEAESKVSSISDNPHVIQLYEQKKKEMEKLSSEVEGHNDEQNMKVTQLEQKRERWESSLVNIVSKVSVKFSSYMKEVGCAGEVRLYNGQKDANINVNDEKFRYNFKDWGVEILVKFREASSLQVLSAQTHSGGERSVSTIMYLMGLQNLMQSPFRCVDEINQGLDERNERLVFKRIVENSTMPPESDALDDHCGQYFLITPKLLPNLDGMENENITVLFVFSGPHNFSNFLDWNVDKFIEDKRRLSQQTQEVGVTGGSPSKKRRSR